MTNIQPPYNFRALFKMSFDVNPLVDFRKAEVFLAFVCTIVLFYLEYLLLRTNNDKIITSTIQAALLDSSIGLLGLLGFIISGLAIISGTVSSKVVYRIDAKGKFGTLLKILFSFNFLGAVVSVLIVLFFFAYFLLSLGSPINRIVYLAVGAVLSYGFFFVIFCAVSLLNTSLNVFILSYLYLKDDQGPAEEEVFSFLTDYKIDAITALLMEKAGLTKDEFCNAVIKRINDDCPVHLKDKVLEAAKKYYSI